MTTYATPYVLIATGSPMVPKLEIVVNQNDDAEAIREAKRITGTVCKAGYHSFTLFRMTGAHTQIATLRVEHVEPLVTVK